MSTPICKRSIKASSLFSPKLNQNSRNLRNISNKLSSTSSKKNSDYRNNSEKIRSSTFSPSKSQGKKEEDEEDTKIKLMFPTHLDVIERMRKIKNLNNPMPFSPKLPPPELRNF